MVVEATGNEKAKEQTVDLVAAGGGIVIVGLVKEGTRVSFPGVDFTREEMTIVGQEHRCVCLTSRFSCSHWALSSIRRSRQWLTDMWEGPRVFHELMDNPGKYHKIVFERTEA